ncbi:bifunctional metallophosphatase/5'-nucleotidase [Rubrivirga sp.]|uniref:bifunctional metallophosphatase/5'-nucleotidase n=1 Tax=Rubrivirga sp. TaxID=1885344 RepID=UPI003B522832
MNLPSAARLLLAVVAVAGCAPTAVVPDVPAEPTPQAVSFTVLHLNDVYEITPVEGGRAGGLARVAGLRQQLRAQDPNTITVLAGDFLSPSALGTARVDGERLYGKQMVAVLNALGLDAAAVGNHEFDVSADAFEARVAEARFPFVSANAVRPDGTPFPGIARRLVWPVAVAPGDTVRVGIASVVLPSNPKEWVHYLDADSTLRAEVARLDAETDVVIGLTHQAFADDVAAAATIPGLDAVLGGHEHENVRAYRGPRLVPVLKADANARTVYVHRVTLDRSTGAVTVASELVPITPATPEDPATAAVVAEWVEVASAGFRADGFDPDRVAVVTTEALDGRESTVRTRPARLGALIAEGFRRAGGAEAGLFNGGSVRVDDVIPAGPFTEYDAIRVLPFGGQVVTVRMPGSLLARVLDQGLANAGTGGFLQTAAVGRQGDSWTVAGAPLDPGRLYTVATSDFLVSGRETGLDYLDAETNPEVELVGEHGDVRRVLLDELVRAYE